MLPPLTEDEGSMGSTATRLEVLFFSEWSSGPITLKGEEGFSVGSQLIVLRTYLPMRRFGLQMKALPSFSINDDFPMVVYQLM